MGWRDPQTGEEQWVLNTENEDGTINRGLTKDPSQAQRVIIGKPDPKVTGGWRNNLSWKGLDLSALFSFSLGGHIMDDPALLYTDTDGETAYQSIGIQQLDRWQNRVTLQMFRDVSIAINMLVTEVPVI